MLAAILLAIPAVGAMELHDAVTANDLVQIDALVASGSPINAVNGENMTALSLAASKGYAKATQALLKGGAAIGTDLHWAAMRGHVEVLEVLLGAGAEVDGPQPEGEGLAARTPLHSAVIGNQAAAIALLVNAGASVDVPLYIAYNSRREDDLEP